MLSTPGYCSVSHMGTTNGQIFGWNGVECDAERLTIVRQATLIRFLQLLNGEDAGDDLKVFIKQEAHKEQKLKEGRLRLISAVSLIDTLVDRVLFGWLARNVLANVGRTPCLVGWSPVRGGWRKIQRRFRNEPVVCLDKSAWDWTVQGYLVDLWKEFLTELPVDPPLWWVQMVGARFRVLFDSPTFRFEDGTRVQQGVRGIMKSGCFLTIILNSVSQSMLHYLANMRCGKDPLLNQPLTIGDDTVQDGFDWLTEYVDQLTLLGVGVKGAKIQNWVEFAGFAFTGETCYPAYWQKHLFNMSHTDNLEEVLHSYQYLYCNENVMSEFCRRVARELGPTHVLPRAVAQDIMNDSH